MSNGQLSLQCDCSPVGDRQYDIDSSSNPADAVVGAIAAVTDTEPLELPPMYETIDPEALNLLFARRTDDPDAPEKVLSFSMNGWNVFVRDDGRIRICDPTGPDDPGPIFD